jgi:hypothetical protein
MTGATVPVGEGVLVSITFDSPTPEICLTEAVMSDAAGAAITTTLGECYTGTPGCMDDSACNYNSDATYDDGSCAYEFDCAGECGGMAMDDCTGACNGDALVDCAGMCEGLSEYDCAGECDGDAVEDVCGACNGTETDPANCIADGFSLSLANVVFSTDTTGSELFMTTSNVPPAVVSVPVVSVEKTTFAKDKENPSAIQLAGSVSVPLPITCTTHHKQTSILNPQQHASPSHSPAQSYSDKPSHIPAQSTRASPLHAPVQSSIAIPPHSPAQSNSYAQEPSSYVASLL